MDWVTWLNTIVGIIGIVVGIIGWKSLSAAIKIKNKFKIGDGAVFNHIGTVNQGLNNADVVELATNTALAVVEKNVNPNECLQLKSISLGVMPFYKKDDSYEYDFDFFVDVEGVTRKYSIKFSFDQQEVCFPQIKCSVNDIYGEAIKLTSFSGFLGVVPQYINNIFDSWGYENETIVFNLGCTAIGKTKEGKVILISVEKAKFQFCPQVKIALYE